MEEKIVLGVSACLLGERVRYDGGHKLDRYLVDVLGPFVRYVPVCPEVECGLPVPREAMRLVGSADSYRLVTAKTGVDMTDRMCRWACRRAAELENEHLCGFVFKARSPSSGMERVKVYGAGGMPSKTGVGLWARELMAHFPLLPVEEEGRLQDPVLRENFIERVFTMHRWHALAALPRSRGRLVEFHTRQKLLVMAHSPKILRELGKVVADMRGRPIGDVYTQYFELLSAALAVKTTSRKHTNVLHHVMGYFKKHISADEKQELVDVIGHYHSGLVPLIVPVTLLNHYVRKFGEPYLSEQVYLNPHPVELKLRNHV